MSTEITLDHETFKALAGEKRIQILKELRERRKTQTELAQKLELSPPTIAEHLQLLKNAGLVEIIDDGHKWKYYALSTKGKKLLNPEETHILVLLATSALAFFGTAAALFYRYWQNLEIYSVQNQSTAAPVIDATVKTLSVPSTQTGVQSAAQIVGQSASETTLQIGQQTAVGTAQSFTPVIQPGELTFLILVSLVFGILLGYYYYRLKT